MLVNKSFRI